MRRFRDLSGLLVVVVVLLSMTGGPPAAGAPVGSAAAVETISRSADSIDWSTCTDAVLVYYGAQCGYVSVPVDYAHPRGSTIQLAVSRIVHTASDADYQGVMLINPGGPGGSGLDLSILGGFVPNGVGGDYDWIGFDPRGVGSSRPALSCEPNYLGPDRPNYVPTSDAALQVWLDRANDYAQACATAQPALLAHVHTTDQARDMDSIRKALGVERINYYGFSYGTYLGSVYNTLFPGRMGRAVFDSNIDPRYVWYRTQLNQDQAEQNSMRLFWSWIAAHHKIYRLGNTELAVEANYFDLRAKLLEHPAAGVVGPDELDDAFDEAAYTPQYSWPPLAEDWANYVHHGDTYYLVQDYETTDNPGNDNLIAVYSATQCTDAPWPSLNQQLSDAYRIQPAAAFYTWPNFWFNAACLFWPTPASTPTIIHGGSLAPLILDDYADGPTPYSGDLEVRRLYPNSSLIGLAGSNHGVSFAGNTCVDNAMSAYLATGALPTRKPGNTTDATCTPMPAAVPITYPGTPPAEKTAPATTTTPATGHHMTIHGMVLNGAQRQ